MVLVKVSCRTPVGKTSKCGSWATESGTGGDRSCEIPWAALLRHAATRSISHTAANLSQITCGPRDFLLFTAKQLFANDAANRTKRVIAAVQNSGELVRRENVEGPRRDAYQRKLIGHTRRRHRAFDCVHT